MNRKKIRVVDTTRKGVTWKELPLGGFFYGANQDDLYIKIRSDTGQNSYNVNEGTTEFNFQAITYPLDVEIHILS